MIILVSYVTYLFINTNAPVVDIAKMNCQRVVGCSQKTTISNFNALRVKRWRASMFLMKRKKQETSPYQNAVKSRCRNGIRVVLCVVRK